MSDEIEIKFDEEQIKTEKERIERKAKLYKNLWRLFSVSNKSLMIINFSIILFSIFTPESNIPLILSIYTLSFSTICDTRIYENILEKLINIYEEEIIPDIDKYIRDYYKNKNCNDFIFEIQKIEKNHLTDHLGSSFMLPNTLRSMDCKRILFIVFIYIFSFTIIALLCYYKSIGKLTI